MASKRSPGFRGTNQVREDVISKLVKRLSEYQTAWIRVRRRVTRRRTRILTICIWYFGVDWQDKCVLHVALRMVLEMHATLFITNFSYNYILLMSTLYAFEISDLKLYLAFSPPQSTKVARENSAVPAQLLPLKGGVLAGTSLFSVIFSSCPQVYTCF